MMPESVPILAARPLTPGGRGAVATVQIAGDLAQLEGLLHCANGKLMPQQDLNRICFGHWGLEAPEEVVCVRTGPSEMEVHCHGGSAAVARILADVRHQGGGAAVSAQEPALSDVERIAAECRQALTQATTQRTAHHLLRQLTLFPEACERLQQLPAEEKVRSANELLRWSHFGLHLTAPWKIVLCGRPNVGKSSLINALVGYQRAVVFDQPGTTRDVVTAETAFDGWPVELSDTAGLRTTAEGLEAAGIQRARERLETADVVVIVLDATQGELSTDDRNLLEPFPDAVLVLNKCDIATTPRFTLDRNVMAVSARTSAGIPELMNELTRLIVPEAPGPDAAFPVTANQVRWLKEIVSSAE